MKNTDGKQRFAQSLQAIGLAVVFLLVAFPGGSFGQTAVGSKHSAGPPPATAIAPEEVAARSSDVTNLVITFSEKFALSHEIEKIQQLLPEISKQIDLDAAETAATVGAQLSLAILETQRALWQRWQLQVGTWLTLFTRRAVELRRIDLPVGVNYGVTPQAVIELLEKTAQAHAAVLKNPPPQGLFMGYGDSSINFELRAWTAQFSNWSAIRSELAAAVYDAVYAAGMAFPFPQRDVRILGDETAQKAAAPRPGGSAETTREEK